MSQHLAQPIPDGVYKIVIVTPKVDGAFITYEKNLTAPSPSWSLITKKDQGDNSNWEFHRSADHGDRPDALITITPTTMVETAVVKLPRNELLIIQDSQVQPDENLWIFVPTGETDTYFIADIHKQTYWILVGQSKDKLSLGTSVSNRAHVKFEKVQS